MMHEISPLRRRSRIGRVAAAGWVTGSFALAAAGPALAQAPPVANAGTPEAPPAAEVRFDPEGFDAYVREAVEAWEAVGLAIAVVKDGDVLFERGYGLLELGRPERVDEHTRFAIGSTTKAMTAATLALLVDDGKVGWDDPVSEHLPEFRLHDPYVTREVTVRDLLTHRAGLGNADFLWYAQEYDADEILRRLRHVEPAYSLRSGFVYQNLMYLAAGAVVEAVSGMPWHELLQRRLLDPLGMTETIPLASRTAGQPNVASPHDEVEGEVRVIENASVDAVAPAGSVWSSVHDMAKWLRFLLAGGVADDGTRILKEATVDELFTPQVVLRAASFYPTVRLTRPSWMTYGLGWFQHDYRGRKVDFHTGSIDGMVAIAGLLRDRGLGVYVLANRDHVEVRHALMYRVFDLFDPHGEPRDWSADLDSLYDGLAEAGRRAREAAEARRVEGTSPSRPLDAYAGTYVHRLLGDVVVTHEGDALRLRFGRLGGGLEHWHYDTFRLRWDAAWRGTAAVTFRLDAAGRVSGLDVAGAEFERRRAPDGGR